MGPMGETGESAGSVIRIGNKIFKGRRIGKNERGVFYDGIGRNVGK